MLFIHSKKLLYFSFVYILFIIYGSLVPLNYKPQPLDEAWLSFSQIRYLNLGAVSRADWIANILLYIPLTFALATAFLSRAKSSVPTTSFILTLILFFSFGLAITIEFYQQFFPPRTVSQNDLLAEAIGSVLGVFLWFVFSERLKTLHGHILFGGKEAFLASVILYTTGYLAISFFPYDFVTSFQELNHKLNNGHDAFFISSSCGGILFCSTKLVLEVFLVIPLGIIMSVFLKHHPNRLTAVLLIGLVLGAAIEFMQLFLISGIAQGISLLTRALGLGLGELIYRKIHHIDRRIYTINFKKYLFIAAIPYLLIVASLNGWTLSDQSIEIPGTEKIARINYLPFYYHYYSTEAVALTSLLSIFAMYLPIGLGVWLWNYHKKPIDYRITASFIAFGLCLIMETGKLFIIGKHPDPTNLLISFTSAFITYSVTELLYQWFHQSQNTQHNTQANDIPLTDATEIQQTNPTILAEHLSKAFIPKSIAFLMLFLLFWKIIDYPGHAPTLTMLLIVYGFILRHFTQAWLFAIPALLPIADLAPWTGRIFFSELDYFIIVTLAVSLWYGRWTSPFKLFKSVAVFLFILYLFFYSISVLKGLLPLPAIDANAFNNYHSQFNSLRIAKGIFWTCLLLPLIAYSQLNKYDTWRYFTYGILSGLSFTVLSGLWERYIFTGLFDYTSDFRISSTFYSMHTGGAHLDTYLLLSMPFIFALLYLSPKSLIRFLLTPLLFSVSFYILLMTYSRGAYIAFVFACFTLLIGLLVYYRKQTFRNWKKALWLPLFFVITTLVAVPVLNNSFMQQRFNQTFQEASFRSTHWQNAINFMENDLFTTLFGSGVGSFPRTYLWHNFADKAPAIFLVQQEQNRHFLQLGSGAPIYIEQLIDISAYSTYTLSLDYRSNTKNTQLNISICEKAIQHSFNCQSVEQLPTKSNTQWQHFQHTINTLIIGESYRPVKLIFYNSKPNSTIDITNISLRADIGDNLIKNGNFSKGMDHWFFTADAHIPWRTENLWVQILFEQGWLGLVSFNLMLLYVIYSLLQQIYRQDFYSLISLTSLSGFLVISVIDSPFDMPNITWLFFMIVFLALRRDKRQAIRKKRISA